MAGTVRFELASGAEMSARRQGHTYVMTAPYPAGTRFQVFVTSPQPAYLYVFGFDCLEKSYRIFPRDLDNKATRAAAQNRIVIPDADHYVRMDETTGTEYFCVLFSRQPLPFTTILQRLEGTHGPFLNRLQTVLDTDLIAAEFIRYTDTGGIGFAAASRGRTIVPMVVVIEHIGEETIRDTTPPHIVVLAPSVRPASAPVERGFDIAAASRAPSPCAVRP